MTPLLALLTESDLENLLGDPAAVAAWCRQQLCRPPAERPAGLTAELSTPQGRAELLLQPELLLRAVSEAVPAERDWWRRRDQEEADEWAQNWMPLPTYHQCRRWLEGVLSRNMWVWRLTCDLESSLSCYRSRRGGPTLVSTARLWRRRLQHLLSGERLRQAYTAVTTRWPDRWQLRQHAVLDSTTEGRTRRRQGWSHMYRNIDTRVRGQDLPELI